MTIEYIIVGVLYVAGVWFSLRRELRSLAVRFPNFTTRSIKRTFVRHDFNVFVGYGVGLIISEAICLFKNVVHQPFSIASWVVALSLLLGFGFLYGSFIFELLAVTPSTMEIKEMFRNEMEKECKFD